MNLITKYRNKEILIFGLGKEGESSLRFFRSLFPNKIIGAYDKKEYQSLSLEIKDFIAKDQKIKFYSGENYEQLINNYDVIIRSPGINPQLVASLKERSNKEIEITSQTKIFFQNTLATIIGVTGTKGKSTTTSLIFQILQLGKGNQVVKLVGNIDRPVLSEIPFDGSSIGDFQEIYVYELSSHQLYDLRKSPDIAIILNLFPDHLDYFGNFKNYKEAKENIIRHQTVKDILIYNADEESLLEMVEKSPAQKFSYSLSSLKANCFLTNDSFYFSKEGDGIINSSEKILDVKEVPLLGQFNFQNIMPSIIVAKIMGKETNLIKAAIRKFKPLPHHLAFVGNYQGINFYDDSIATIPPATIAALKAMGDSVETLIIGGSDKGLEVKQLRDYIIKESSIKTMLLFAPTGDDIQKSLVEQKKVNPRNKIPQMFKVKSMEEAVKLAYKYTAKGKICLLSPASASFNLFKNYKERGDIFIALVKKIGDEKR
jgi:UDP-N-acetylmuramoylalanine--D-glutamate ligase